jgi:hypothetical protein
VNLLNKDPFQTGFAQVSDETKEIGYDAVLDGAR